MTRNAEHTPSPQSVGPSGPKRVLVLKSAVERLILAADMYGVAHLDSDDMDDDAVELQDATEGMKDAIAAAPAPSSLAGGDGSFRGAEWFGVTGAADETEALAVALFDARCPGIRMIDEDLHYYRAAAQRAMQAVADELDTPALTPRHEAPADKDPVPSEWTGQGADADFFKPAKTAFSKEAPAEGAGDGWIVHDGRENPAPGQRVDVKMTFTTFNDIDADTFDWNGRCHWRRSDRARSSAPEAREGEVS